MLTVPEYVSSLPVMSGIPVALSSFLSGVLNIILCNLSCGHCIGCSSSIYGFCRQKNNDGVTGNTKKAVGGLLCSSRVGSFCSSNDTFLITIVINTVISHA